MSQPDGDAEFPECCARCPYLEPVKATCEHEASQTLIEEISTGRTCSIYSRVRADAMRRLSESMSGPQN